MRFVMRRTGSTLAPTVIDFADDDELALSRRASETNAPAVPVTYLPRPAEPAQEVAIPETIEDPGLTGETDKKFSSGEKTTRPAGEALSTATTQ